jgi:hypothetical protein
MRSLAMQFCLACAQQRFGSGQLCGVERAQCSSVSGFNCTFFGFYTCLGTSCAKGLQLRAFMSFAYAARRRMWL